MCAGVDACISGARAGRGSITKKELLLLSQKKALGKKYNKDINNSGTCLKTLLLLVTRNSTFLQ